MRATNVYQEWINSPYVDERTKSELSATAENVSEIEDRFYKHLEFGTGGLRGLLGAGTNRVNRYTIGRATQGLANTICRLGAEAMRRGVVIAYDSRDQSAELALETATVLAANEIQVYLFESLRPTPELSFAVRELGAQAGIVVTASHNPPAYNGYKVYGADGGQMVPAQTREITAAIEGVQSFEDVRRMAPDEAEATGRLQWIGADLDDRYIARLRQLCLHAPLAPEAADALTVVYTPLHGAGNRLVQRILREIGLTRVFVVPEQEQPDPQFSTVTSPNPEERAAFDLGLQLAERVQADLIVATDPDADRVGVVARRRDGSYELLSGNQTGALLLQYLLEQHAIRGTLPPDAVLVKTIVTSDLGRKIAARYGVQTIETLTGFKYIGEQMRLFEQTGDATFFFGYEESYGYLAGDFVRDKDAVMATMLVCEMAAFYKQNGQTLLDVLETLYAAHGYHSEALVSRALHGFEGIAMIRSLMEEFRTEPLLQIGALQVVEQADYLTGMLTDFVTGQQAELELPQENALFYRLSDQSWFCLRPSGTEPKIKFYFSCLGQTQAEADGKLRDAQEAVLQRIDRVVG